MYYEHQNMVTRAAASRRVIFTPGLVTHILQCLSPRDLVRLRTVSQYFNGITRDRRLWCILYAGACFPLPLGPFEWQSTRFLECAVIKSERTSLTWTSQPTLGVALLAPGPRVALLAGSLNIPPWHFLLDRLFVWCEETWINAYDTATRTCFILWKSPTAIRCSSIEALTLGHPDGQRVYIAFLAAERDTNLRPVITLLEFRVPHDPNAIVSMRNDYLKKTFAHSSQSISMNGSFPFLYFNDRPGLGFIQFLPLLIDTRTWVEYEFLPFERNVQGLAVTGFPRDNGLTLSFVVPSRTHILLTQQLFIQSSLMVTYIQVFAVPEWKPRPESKTLRLTHTFLTQRMFPPPMQLLRDSIVDSLTGNIRIRFLGMMTDTRLVSQYSYIDLELSPSPAPVSHTPAVTPQVPHQRHFIKVCYHALFQFPGRMRHFLLQSSDKGHARGLAISGSRLLYRFSIDASGRNCTTVFSQPESPLPGHPFLTTRCLTFDGVRGRVCYDVESQDARSRDLVVAEFR